MLKASARNCKFHCSLMLIFLNSDVSKVVRAGPVKEPRDVFPNVPESGNENAPESKYRPVFLNPSTPRITGPLKAGLRLGTSGLSVSPVPETFAPISGVKGKPLWALAIPFHC